MMRSPQSYTKTPLICPKHGCNRDTIRAKQSKKKAYLNCPMTKIQYENFIDALLEAEKTEFREEEHIEYFNGCLPIEVMAERGRETLRFGPMKPVGLTNPNSKEKPYAIVQLRKDNAIGTLYNIVGFQTKMKYGAQKSVFSMIPGLENANFARLGGSTEYISKLTPIIR